MKKLYLKADSIEYLEHLKKQKAVSRADLMINPVQDEFGKWRGFLLNGFQETVANYIAEYQGD